MSRLPMIVVAAERHSTAAVLTCFFVSPMHSGTIGTTSSIADRVRCERVEREGARLPRLLAVHRTEQRALDHAESIADASDVGDDVAYDASVLSAKVRVCRNFSRSIAPNSPPLITRSASPGSAPMRSRAAASDSVRVSAFLWPARSGSLGSTATRCGTPAAPRLSRQALTPRAQPLLSIAISAGTTENESRPFVASGEHWTFQRSPSRRHSFSAASRKDRDEPCSGPGRRHGPFLQTSSTTQQEEKKTLKAKKRRKKKEPAFSSALLLAVAVAARYAATGTTKQERRWHGTQKAARFPRFFLVGVYYTGGQEVTVIPALLPRRSNSGDYYSVGLLQITPDYSKTRSNSGLLQITTQAK